MAYPTAADLVGASDEPELAALSDEATEEVRLLAIGAVESYCGQSFAETTATRVLPAQGGHTLPLDKRLAELTSLEGAGSSLDAGDVAFNDRHSALYVTPSAFSSNWVERTLREDMPPAFSSGAVTIEGIWGWLDTEIPGDDLAHPVNMAIRIDMEAQALARAQPLAEAARTMAKIRSDSITEGPLTIRSSGTVLPISAELQALLEDFIWQPVGRLA